MDIKQAPNARAVMTLGKDCTFRDAAQAAWRMRGLAKGQTLRLCVVPEVQGLVKQAVGADSFETKPMINNVVGWLVRNSIEFESLQFQQLCRQDLANAWRRAAFDDLMAMHGLVGRQYSERGLLHSMDTVQDRVAVFREPVDFSLSMDSQKKPANDDAAASGSAIESPLSAFANDARKKFASYIRGPKADKRIQDVLVRNAMGSEGGHAASAQDLDAEQEQEQEVLQEAEREQDQQKELEYVAWYKRPDIDVPKPAPWSIKALQSCINDVQRRAKSGDMDGALSEL